MNKPDTSAEYKAWIDICAKPVPPDNSPEYWAWVAAKSDAKLALEFKTFEEFEAAAEKRRAAAIATKLPCNQDMFWRPKTVRIVKKPLIKKDISEVIRKAKAAKPKPAPRALGIMHLNKHPVARDWQVRILRTLLAKPKTVAEIWEEMPNARKGFIRTHLTDLMLLGLVDYAVYFKAREPRFRINPNCVKDLELIK